MSTARLVLPFAVLARDRVRAFSPSMEVAAVLFLTEENRKKRSLLRTQPKKTMLVSKLHYPLWAIPIESETLIVDGLGAVSSTIILEELPDVSLLIDDIEHAASVRKQFWDTLEKHQKTFEGFAKSTAQIQMRALLTDQELLSALFECAREAVALKLVENDSVVLAPLRLDSKAAAETAKRVSELFNRIRSEMRSLEYLRNLLIETGRFHEQMIRKEAELTREACEAEVSKLRPEVEGKVGQLLKERDARLVKMKRLAENELRTRERERERRERELQRLELSKASYLRRLETRRHRHDKMGAANWEHRVRNQENRIEEVKSRLRAVSEYVEKTRRQWEEDTKKLRYGYQVLIDQEERKIIDLEVQRDATIEFKQGEIERLRLTTDQVAGQVDALVRRKREQESELKRMAIPWRFESAALLCLPFYLVCYQAEDKTQFQILPPMNAMGSEGVVKTLQKTIRSLTSASGLTLYLQQRSQALSRMLESVLEERLEPDEAFRESVLQAAASSNVLTWQNLKEVLTKGVEELKAEGWMSQGEGEALIKTYT